MKHGEDRLRLSGQRAEEKRTESKRTMTVQPSVVKILLLWPSPQLWAGRRTQLVNTCVAFDGLCLN